MRRTVAITAATAMLALSLAGCGAKDGGADMRSDGRTGTDSVTATDTMRGERGNYGTGTNAGASTGSYGTTANGTANGYGTVTNGTANGYGAASGTNSGLGSVSGAVNRGYAGETRRDGSGIDRYELMLENGRVHDTDGFLLDGENAHYHTF